MKSYQRGGGRGVQSIGTFLILWVFTIFWKMKKIHKIRKVPIDCTLFPLPADKILDGRTDKRTTERTDERTNERTEERTNGRTNERTNGRTEERTN